MYKFQHIIPPPPDNVGKSGFTLIEISIVLVIIGLIVGGVLVGQDLIRAASIRAQLTQIERYNTAINTFKGKYGGIPGDLQYSIASQFGFATRTGALGHGNGNGLLETGPNGSMVICAETVLFWADLTTAGLIDGNFQGADGNSVSNSCTTSASLGSVSVLIPPAKLGRANHIAVLSDTGFNYYQILGNIATISNVGYPKTSANAWPNKNITPLEAYTMDSKIDDGYPTTGTTTARATTWTVAPALDPAGAPADSICVSNATTPNPYNTDSSTGGNSNGCSIQFRFN